MRTQAELELQLPRPGTTLVIVDVQERLVPAMPEKVYRQVLANIQLLRQAAELLRLPVLTTEQYPRGLGHTVAELRGGKTIEKITFGCCGEPAFLKALDELETRRVLLVGMEAHVCVYQTLLGLRQEGFGVHLVQDAICSQRKTDYRAALQNAPHAGAILTSTEMALFQLLERAGTVEFKAISTLIKNR